MEISHEIDAMQQNILRMGARVDTALRKTLAALELHDYDLAAEVIREDSTIDAFQATIEDQCTRIISTAHPDPADLRQLLVGIKISSSLERIGDHARHLARRARVVTDPLFVEALPLVRRMAQIDTDMLHDSLTAYVQRDAGAARAIAARDDEIDALNNQLYRLLIGIMQEHPETIEKGIELMMVNRFLERLGDHVTNICEWIVFATRNEHVELNA
ncbi:MAG: phosphate transport system regulatory protein PhoU [Spirochaetaceae bacterium]|nr:MAG: phosphate transport system regulatory protein PhoU [Spirochaetaceae bacterium]